MKVACLLLLVLGFCNLGWAAEVVVQNPALTIQGHYRSRDGRVREHKFPVKLKLLASGKVDGIFESWIEERLSNGTSSLDYFSTSFTGDWSINKSTLQIVVEKGILPAVIFKKYNGLTIVIQEKSP